MKEYDGKQEVELARDDIKCPDGWLWKGEWQVDMGRAVDDEGQCGGHLLRVAEELKIRTHDDPSPSLPFLSIPPSLPPPSPPPPPPLQGGSTLLRLGSATGCLTRGMATSSVVADGCGFE